MKRTVFLASLLASITLNVSSAHADTPEQRGLFVFQHVCSACHGMERAHYGDMAALSPSLPALEEWSKQHHADLNAPIASPYPNEAVGKAANGGDFPPDLSHIARTIKGGPDYIETMLHSYTDPPTGTVLAPQTYYNPVALTHHHRFKMRPPLHDHMLRYPDGTEATTRQMAHDVTAFLQWSDDSHRANRLLIGSCVTLYLFIMTGLLLWIKRRIWRDARS